MLYEIGDKVQAHDGRIGVVIDIAMIADGAKGYDNQIILVKFFDGSMMEDLANHFVAIFDRPFAKVEP